jgi:homoserine O-succinyltransferase
VATRAHELATSRGGPPGAPLVVGLVNSMPGEARRQTEQQFRTILAGALPDRAVDVRLFSLDPATPAGGPHHDDTALLEGAAPDCLIVTGMPPRAPSLTDEPYWHRLTELVDYAIDNAVPTMWSCLAAHAAVLHLDGIGRRRLPEKLSGLFDCTRTEAAHPLLAGLPRRWRMPHSRYNEVPEAALLARGYRILSRSADGGVDLFTRDGTASLFCQGHPEYDADTLLREYRRDIRQFLAGERESYPEMPQNYFAPAAMALAAGFRARAERARHIDLFAEFPTAGFAAGIDHGWHALAVALYANWLAPIAGQIAGRAVRHAETTAAPMHAAEAG